jgi:hypothetical protein
MIALKKQVKANYEIQFLINLLLNYKFIKYSIYKKNKEK